MGQIKVKTESTTYQYINRFEIWDKDVDYFIFYWEDDKFIIIRKNLVLSIKQG